MTSLKEHTWNSLVDIPNFFLARVCVFLMFTYLFIIYYYNSLYKILNEKSPNIILDGQSRVIFAVFIKILAKCGLMTMKTYG